MPEPETILNPYVNTREISISNWMPMTPDPAYFPGLFNGGAFGVIKSVPVGSDVVETPVFLVVGNDAEIQDAIEGFDQWNRITAAGGYIDPFFCAAFVPVLLGSGAVGRFVIGGNDGEIQTVDADTMTAVQRLTAAGNMTFVDIKLLNGVLVAGGSAGPSPYLFISTDNGENWVDKSIPLPGTTGAAIWSIAGGMTSQGYRMIAVGYKIPPAPPTPIPLILVSDDNGESWVEGTFDPNAPVPPAIGFWGAEFYKGKFYSIEQIPPYIQESEFGLTWTRIPKSNKFFEGGPSAACSQFVIYKDLLLANLTGSSTSPARVLYTKDVLNWRGGISPLRQATSPAFEGGFKGLIAGKQSLLYAGFDDSGPNDVPLIYSSTYIGGS